MKIHISEDDFNFFKAYITSFWKERDVIPNLPKKQRLDVMCKKYPVINDWSDLKYTTNLGKEKVQAAIENYNTIVFPYTLLDIPYNTGQKVFEYVYMYDMSYANLTRNRYQPCKNEKERLAYRRNQTIGPTLKDFEHYILAFNSLVKTRTLDDYFKNYCNISSLEKEVRKILINNHVYYNSEVRFDDCKDQFSLPFDFKIYTDKAWALIEVDGEQHYEPTEYFGGQEAFETRKHHDFIKNEYCESKNIPLLRIPYFQMKDAETLIMDFIQAI